mmetsp:Transcript_11550/g.11566  ORF Transcript_11550/g.11566 Transcript_11550/m.11566 type:complete len:361 (+) Transcript_11550:28-1110(+)
MNCFVSSCTSQTASLRTIAARSEFCPASLPLLSQNFRRVRQDHTFSLRASKRAAATMSTSSSTVGFLGLGIMGYPMAKNLVSKAGRSLIVWNRDAQKSQSLVKELGSDSVQVAASPSEVIQRCDVTFVMLSTPAAVHSVLLEMPNAVVEGVSAGKYIIDCSTIAEQDSLRSAAAIRSAGGKFLEAPVSGSKVPAEMGALIFLTAGDREVFDLVGEEQGLLAAMGKKSLFLGDVGKGARMKMAVNMVMGSMVAAFAEGMVLCECNELGTADFLEVLDAGAMSNPMFRLKGPNMVKGEHLPHFPLEHQQKDMRFALQMGDSSNTSMPVAAAANELFKTAKGLGHSRDDMSAVVEALRTTKKE